MEYTITGKSPDKLEEKLAQYNKLTALREDLTRRLEKARSEKESVSPKIYDKVIGEYSGKLENVHEQLSPVESELERNKKECEEELPQLAEEIRLLEDELAEAEFRFRVGEYDQNKLTEIQTRLNPDLADRSERQAHFTERLDAINAGLINDAPGDCADKSSLKDDADEDEKGYTNEPDDDGAAGGDGTDDGSSSRVTLNSDDPLEELTDEPTEKAADTSKDEVETRSDSESPSESQDKSFENPQEWIDELGKAAEESEPKAAPPESAPSAKSEEKAEDDPLSALADPSGDPGEGEKSAVTVEKAEAPKKGSVGFPNMVIITGTSSGKKIPLLPMTMSIGREHDNNIELKDPDVGRYHARILFDRGRFLLEDLESSNGTWLNGEKISEAALTNGDRVKIGGTEFAIDFD